MYKHSKHVEQKIKQMTSVGLYLFNYQDDARSNKLKIHSCNTYRLFNNDISSMYSIALNGARFSALWFNL